MIRIFIDTPLKSNSIISLDDKLFHYLFHVMRCHEGDQVLCFNGQDGEWMCHLQLLNRKHASLHVLDQTRAQINPSFCALCPALIKKDNMDLVLQKATELGASDIFPIISDHAVHIHFNKEHAQLIVREASEQCERLTLPIIHTPQKLPEILNKLPKDCVCVCLSERAQSSDMLPSADKIAFFVGPEGGWSEKEKLFFTQKSFKKIHFDVGILRAETASIAILSCWQIGRNMYLKK